jgi:hypothetical protein
MNKEPEKMAALVVLLVRRAANRIESLFFGNDISFLPKWFSRHRNDQHVETNITLQNADESWFVMPCSYNLN